ncbi:MAG: hypothetical protein WCG10_05695 [Chlamydiota bacterium]
MTTYLDVALEGIGFLNVPDVTHPPAVTYYEPNFQDAPIGSFPIDKIVTSLRTSIHPIDGYLTSLQTKKVSMLAVAVIGIAASAALASYMPIAAMITAVATVVFTSYKFIQYFSTYDLEQEGVRNQVTRDIQVWSFDKIANTFTFSDLIGYDLLQNKLAFVPNQQIPHCYAYVQFLYGTKSHIDQDTERLNALAKSTYKIGTAAIKSWIEGCRSRSFLITMYKPRPQDNQYTNIDAARDGIRLALEAKSTQLKAPWKTWLREEQGSIATAHMQAINCCNEAYNRML